MASPSMVAMWFFMGFMGLFTYSHGLQKFYLLCITGVASILSLSFLDFALARAGGGPSQSMVGHVVLHLFGLLAVTWLTNVLFVIYHRFLFQVVNGLPWFRISQGGKWLLHRWWAMRFFMGFIGFVSKRYLYPGNPLQRNMPMYNARGICLVT